MTNFTSCFTVFADQMSLNLDNISKFLERGTGIGKILKKLKLSDKDVQAGVLAFRSAEFAAQIQMAEDASDIAGAYSCIKSCMTNFSKECGKFYSHQTLVDQGIRVALFCQHGQIVGRCVVNTLTKKRMSHYTVIGHEEFDLGLTELGYHFFDDNRFIEESPFADINLLEVSNGFIPYNDGGGELFQSGDAAFYLDANIEDSNPDFSDAELELILQAFELAGHPVSDVSQLKMWAGKCWFSYGKFSNHSDHWKDWDLMIYRTPFGYHSEQGDEGISQLCIFDDNGNLIPIEECSEDMILYTGQDGVWEVKRMCTLWYHEMPV